MIFHKKDDLQIEKMMKARIPEIKNPRDYSRPKIPEKTMPLKNKELIIPGRINRMYGGEMKKKKMMYGGMAKKKMMKGGRAMYSAGGSAMPVAKPN